MATAEFSKFAGISEKAMAPPLQHSCLENPMDRGPIPKKGNAKECSNYRTIAVISHASKVMLKILQARLRQYVNRELPDVQAGFRKGRGTRDRIALSLGFSRQEHWSGLPFPSPMHEGEK